MDAMSRWGVSEWGSLGSAVGGIATVLLAVLAAIVGRAGWGDWREKQRQEGRLAAEMAENTRLERHRTVHGWTPGSANSYAVQLVTEPVEIAQAAQELASGADSEFVLVRVDGGRAHQLRQLVATSEKPERPGWGYVARAPDKGEFEAIETGMEALGIPLSGLSARRRAGR